MAPERYLFHKSPTRRPTIPWQLLSQRNMAVLFYINFATGMGISLASHSSRTANPSSSNDHSTLLHRHILCPRKRLQCQQSRHPTPLLHTWHRCGSLHRNVHVQRLPTPNFPSPLPRLYHRSNWDLCSHMGAVPRPYRHCLRHDGSVRLRNRHATVRHQLLDFHFPSHSCTSHILL